jgi:CheY-specific phosphatase CheX
MEPTKQPPTTDTPDLTTVVTDVLGDLAFMVTDDQQPEPVSHSGWLEAGVDYYGPASGTLRCWCTRAFARQLAATLLGIEPEEGEALAAAEDAVREFMNVLCGQVVTTWHGTESVFNLSIPSVCERLEPPPIEDTAPGARCHVSIGGEPLLCTHHGAP